VEVIENRYFFGSCQSKIACPDASWVNGLIALRLLWGVLDYSDEKPVIFYNLLLPSSSESLPFLALEAFDTYLRYMDNP
jgi:hypothetical protein